MADLQKDIAAASEEVDEAAAQPPASSPAISPIKTQEPLPEKEAEPSFGGTLNATTEQAAQDKRRELTNDQNHTILTHGGNSYVGDSSPTFQSPLNAATQSEYEPPVIDPFSQAPPAGPDTSSPVVSYAPPVQPPNETLADLDAKTRAPHDEARAAVDAAFNNPPAAAPVQPQSMLQPAFEQPAVPAPPAPSGVPPLPPMPDFSTLPPMPPAPNMETPAAAPSGALPPEKLEEVLGSNPPAPRPAPQSNDPGQFRIPGQS